MCSETPPRVHLLGLRCPRVTAAALRQARGDDAYLRAQGGGGGRWPDRADFPKDVWEGLAHWRSPDFCFWAFCSVPPQHALSNTDHSTIPQPRRAWSAGCWPGAGSKHVTMWRITEHDRSTPRASTAPLEGQGQGRVEHTGSDRRRARSDSTRPRCELRHCPEPGNAGTVPGGARPPAPAVVELSSVRHLEKRLHRLNVCRVPTHRSGVPPPPGITSIPHPVPEPQAVAGVPSRMSRSNPH